MLVYDITFVIALLSKHSGSVGRSTALASQRSRVRLPLRSLYVADDTPRALLSQSLFSRGEQARHCYLLITTRQANNNKYIHRAYELQKAGRFVLAYSHEDRKKSFFIRLTGSCLKLQFMH